MTETKWQKDLPKCVKKNSFLYSTAHKHRQAQVNVVHCKLFRFCGKRCKLMMTKERTTTVNNFHGLLLNRKLGELRIIVTQADLE